MLSKALFKAKNQSRVIEQPADFSLNDFDHPETTPSTRPFKVPIPPFMLEILATADSWVPRDAYARDHIPFLVHVGEDEKASVQGDQTQGELPDSCDLLQKVCWTPDTNTPYLVPVGENQTATVEGDQIPKELLDACNLLEPVYDPCSRFIVVHLRGLIQIETHALTFVVKAETGAWLKNRSDEWLFEKYQFYRFLLLRCIEATCFSHDLLCILYQIEDIEKIMRKNSEVLTAMDFEMFYFGEIDHQITARLFLASLARAVSIGDSAEKIVAIEVLNKGICDSSTNGGLVPHVTKTGVVATLVDILKDGASVTDLVFKTTSLLNSIVSHRSEDTQAVVDAGAIPMLVQLLSSPEQKVKEEAMWALGNIAADTVKSRDMVLEAGALTVVFDDVHAAELSLFQDNMMWFLLYLGRKPVPKFDQFKDVIKVLPKLLNNPVKDSDNEAVCDAMGVLADFCDGRDDSQLRLDMVVQAGLLLRLVEVIEKYDDFDKHEISKRFFRPAERIIRRVLSGTDAYENALVLQGAVPFLTKMVDHHNNKNEWPRAADIISDIAKTVAKRDEIDS